MFKCQISAVFFLYSIVFISPLQAMFRPPKVKAPKARPVTKASTIPTQTVPKAPTTSTPRAPRSVSVSKENPSLWQRLTAYWTQKRSYHTTVPTYQEKKSPGSSAGFETGFSWSKLFNFENPFSWNAWSTSGNKSGKSSTYEEYYEENINKYTNKEKIDEWFAQYRQEKNLSHDQYPDNVALMRYILGTDNYNTEALDYVYSMMQFYLQDLKQKKIKRTPTIVEDLNGLALIAMAVKLDRFVKLFSDYDFPTTSAYYEKKYGSGGSEKAESAKQEQAKEQTYEKKQEEPRAESSTGESFWSQANKQYRYNQYDTDKKRKERIWDILAKGNYSKEDIEDVYNLFEAMLTNADSNYVVPTFIDMTKFGIGKGDARYKTLYGRVKPRDKKTLEGDMPDDIAIAQRLNLVLCILNSFYKDDPNAIYYAYGRYSELPPRYQLWNFSLIIKNGGTKISHNFRELLGFLSFSEIGKTPNISLIHAIKTYDSDNKEAMAYANRMFEKLKLDLKIKLGLNPQADNIELIDSMVYAANAGRANRLENAEATAVILLLEEAFESFRKNKIDPRTKYPDWTGFYKRLDRVYSDLNNPLKKIFEKYGFYPSPEYQQSGYSSGARQEQSYHRPSSAGRAKVSDYDILGVKQGTSSEEMHKKYLELVNKYHPDKIRSRGGSEQEMKEGEQKLKKINAAYDRIGRK